MKDKAGKAIGDVACLRDEIAKEICLHEPDADGKGPKGNPSAAGQNSGSKSKKDGNRRKRNKGRS